MLDTKSVVKINYDAPIASTTNLKKHKVQNGLIQTVRRRFARIEKELKSLSLSLYIYMYVCIYIAEKF